MELGYPEENTFGLGSPQSRVNDAVCVHLVFKQNEPRSPLMHVSLLVVLPALLSTFLWNKYGAVPSIYIAFTLFLAVLATSIVLYRLSPIHPLAHYPGPLPHKIMKLSFSWIVMQGQSHIYLQDLHECYRDIVRIGPNEVSIRNAEVVQHMLSTSGLPKILTPDDSSLVYIGRTMWFANHPMLVMSGEEHLAQQKWWNWAFNSTALKSYETIVSRRAEQLAALLVKAANEKTKVDLGFYFSWFTWNFMNDMVFGGGSDMLMQGPHRSIWHILDKGVASGQFFANLPWLAVYTSKIPAFGHNIKRLRMYGIQRTKERIQHGSVNKDLFYYLNGEDGTEKGVRPMANVISDSTLAVIAGSDTTANFLLFNPSEYRHLQAEVDRFYLPGKNALNTRHHQNMANEALHLLPILANGSEHTTPAGSRLVGSVFLPERTNASVHVYSINHDPCNFAPHTAIFWPNCWLVASEDISAAEAGISDEVFVHNAGTFIPFSLGPANCMGKNLALREMRMLICLIMQCFFLHLAPGYDPTSYKHNIRNLFIMKKPELLRFTCSTYIYILCCLLPSVTELNFNLSSYWTHGRRL
ncbi:cytochrome P450 [Obba rivulosa]|uniref:Cytochrome P450 n=1 Tax=Obba rivulosa TaxID=1052685 RepID=A0A8E2AU31_9APHY|nr:cytochrome P450 [Obba rivulosa]